jgi:hypothetical protein
MRQREEKKMPEIPTAATLGGHLRPGKISGILLSQQGVEHGKAF